MRRRSGWVGAVLLGLFCSAASGAKTEEPLYIEEALDAEPVLEAIAHNAVQEAPQEVILEPAELPVLQKAVKEVPQ